MAAAIRKAYADTSAGQIHYRYVEGPGTPIVMLHRAPASSVSFVPMMNLWAGERGLYAFDIPGFGQSFAPGGDPSAADYGRWILEAIDHIGLGSFHMFLHHTGTHFGTEIAALNPGRVASLALNGIAYLTVAERASHAAAVRAGAVPDEKGHYMAGQFERIAGMMSVFEAGLYHEEMIGSFQSHFSRHKSFAAIWRQDYPAVLKRVACPILATCAENEFWRFCFDRVFMDTPRARRVLLGPAKFFTPELDAAAVVDALRAFLTDVESGSLR